MRSFSEGFCRRFYGIGDEFPWDQLIVRSDIEKKRTMYFVSKPVQRLLVFTQKTHRPLKVSFQICSTGGMYESPLRPLFHLLLVHDACLIIDD